MFLPNQPHGRLSRSAETVGNASLTDEGIWIMKKATPALLLAGLAVSACLQAQAAEPQANQPQAAVGTDNAVMVGIDAKTGKLRPLTAAQARALSAKAANMPRKPVPAAFATVPRTDAQVRATVRHHPNGATSARTPLSSMSQVSVHRGADGQLIMAEGHPGDSAPAMQQEVSK